MSKPINCNKFSSRRTDQTTENNSQEMAAYLFSRKRRSKGHEQELREELLRPPRIGIENYPSRKAFGTHLSDSHSPTFSDLINGFSGESMLPFLMPVLRKKAETKGRKMQLSL